MAVYDLNERRNKSAPLRALPNNTEAEQALLGAIMINPDALYRVSDFLAPEHFFWPAHREIYAVSQSLITAGKTATPVTLPTFLPVDLECGGASVTEYLAYLVAEATTILNAGDYGRVVYDLARRRSLIAIAESMANVAYDAPVDATPEAQIEDVEKALFELAETGKYGQGFIPFAKVLARALELAAKAYQRDSGLTGLATRILDLDNLLGGLQNSDLIILAARPGMGKTALATNIAYNIALDGAKVGYFSLEMSYEQLGTRIIGERANISSVEIRRGRISEENYETMVQVAREIQDLNFYIDESGGLSIGQIAARARRLKRTFGLDFLVIDYLQLATGTTRRSAGDRVAEITEITTRLKALAKELNVPILALSQLSRAAEQRSDKRPQLTDLRDSGSIEQDADVVMFVFREEYYHALAEPSDPDKLDDWLAERERLAGKADVIVAKQRHGPIGVVNLQFDAALTRFSDLQRS
jgi:replicative DNA helicase